MNKNKLVAEEGFMLTDGKGVYGKVIILPLNSDGSEYYKITEAEYNEVMEKLALETEQNM